MNKWLSKEEMLVVVNDEDGAPKDWPNSKVKTVIVL